LYRLEESIAEGRKMMKEAVERREEIEKLKKQQEEDIKPIQLDPPESTSSCNTINFVQNENEPCIYNNYPAKYEDPGTPCIKCKMPNNFLYNALLDSGSGVNVLPFYLFQRMNLGLLVPYNMIISLADHSIISPRGIAEDVEVRIGALKFLLDFVILDTIPNTQNHAPVLLGRPFLATADVNMSFRNGMLNLTDGIQIGFENIFRPMYRRRHIFSMSKSIQVNSLKKFLGSRKRWLQHSRSKYKKHNCLGVSDDSSTGWE
jgi:hypothetical protein